MNRLCTALLMATLIGPGLAAAPDMPVQRESESHVVLRFDGGGMRTVDLRTITGGILVTTENRDDVRLRVTRRLRAERETDLATAARDVRLETATNAATVSALARDREQTCGEPNPSRGQSWWVRPRYQVDILLAAVVPPGTRIRLCTVSGEAIVASGPFADFGVTNIKGPIELSGVRGSGG